MKNHRIFFSLFVLLLFAFSLSAQPRERLLFNENWLFQKDDPKGTEGVLNYEKIKDWVRASGNEFVLTSNAVKSARPSENLGESVEFTRKDFNDSVNIIILNHIRIHSHSHNLIFVAKKISKIIFSL